MLAQFLDNSIREPCRVSQVCKSWSIALGNEVFWSDKLHARFGADRDLYHPRFREPDVSDFAHPREVYGATHALERRFSTGEFRSRSRSSIDSPVTCIAMATNQIAVGDVKGRIHFYDNPDMVDHDSPSTTPTEPVVVETSAPVSCLTYAGSTLISGHANGLLSVWPIEVGPTVIPVHQQNARVSGIALSFATSIITASSADQSVRVTDLSTTADIFVRRFAPDAAPNTVSSDGSNLVLIGCRDSKSRLVDLRTSNSCIVFELDDWCLSVEISTDPNYIRASDKAVRLFDIRNPAVSVESRHQSQRLISRFKSDSSLRLVSCGLDGEVKVSSLEAPDTRPTSLWTDDDYILSIDFNRTTLTCGGMNGKFETFSFN